MYQRMLTASTLVALLFGAGLTTGADKKDDKTWDKQLEGEWEQQSMIRDGKEQGEPDKPLITFTKDTLSVKMGETTQKFPLAVNATKKPRTIDLTIDKGPDKDKKALGIYELKGDVLRLCFSKPGK